MRPADLQEDLVDVTAEYQPQQAAEEDFRQWYGGWAGKTGINPDPYDYRAAYRAGAEPSLSPEDGSYHWPSQFKAQDHPNRFVNGVDTITGHPVEDVTREDVGPNLKDMVDVTREYAAPSLKDMQDVTSEYLDLPIDVTKKPATPLGAHYFAQPGDQRSPRELMDKATVIQDIPTNLENRLAPVVGAYHGLTRELPSMVGKAMQFTRVAPETGKKITEWAEQTPVPNYQGAAKVMYEGTKMLGPSVIPAGVLNTVGRVITGANKALKLASAAKAAGDLEQAAKHLADAERGFKIASEAANVGTGLLFGASQAQETKETAEKRGVEPGIAPYLTGTIDALGEYAGTKYLGKALGFDESKAITSALDFLKLWGVEVGTEFGQNVGQAAVEKSSGIRPEAKPLEEGLSAIAPTTVMTGLTFGLGKVREARRGQEPLKAAVKGSVQEALGQLEEPGAAGAQSAVEARQGQVAPRTATMEPSTEEVMQSGGKEVPEVRQNDATRSQVQGVVAASPSEETVPGPSEAAAPAATPNADELLQARPGPIDVAGAPSSSGPGTGYIYREGEQSPDSTVDTAAHEAATSPLNEIEEPSDAQKEAGNYKKGHVTIQGLDIAIENPKGSERSGVDRKGTPWSVEMKSHYGYIKGTRGKDKDHLDVFVGPQPERDRVYVVNQVDPETGKFDEHKVMLGYESIGRARKAYLENYAQGWKGLRNIVPMSMEEFKTWLKAGNTKRPARITGELPAGTIKGGPTEIGALYDYAVTDKTNQKRAVHYASVDENEAAILHNISGLDLKGYRHTIDSYGVHHILTEHGTKDILRGHVPVTREDIVRIPEIIQNPDSREVVGKGRVGRELIKYTKRYNGTVLVFEEIRKKRDELVFHTMRKMKAPATSNAAPSEAAPSPTSKTLGGLSNPTIPPASGEVNSYDQSHLLHIRGRLETSEGPTTARDAAGETMRLGSGYPDWFRGKEYTKAQVLNIIDKALKGKKLTPTQQAILKDLVESSRKEYRQARQIEIDPATLRPGDKVVIGGEEYELKGYDKKTGEAILKDGSIIRIDPFDPKPLKVDEVKRKETAGEGGPGGTSTLADTGGYALQQRQAAQLPEIVELAAELNSGKYPRIRKLLRAARGMALGQFAPGRKEIRLRADIFATPGLAERVLAHEVGHLVDYLPDQTMKRGNILGRIATLKKYMLSMIAESPSSSAKPLTNKQRDRIKSEATKHIAAKYGRTMTEFFKDKHFRDAARDEIAEEVRKRIKYETERRGLITKAEIITELRALTQKWKPFAEAANPKFTRYRYSPEELYADALSVLINDPALLKETAPKFYKAFFSYLERKPEVKEIYDEIQQRLTDKEAVAEHRTERVREMFAQGEEAALEAQERKKPLDILKSIKKALVDVNAELQDRVKKAGRQLAPEDNPVYWVEELPYVSGEVYNHLRELERDILQPAREQGISLDDLGEYLLYRRIVGERGGMANPLGHTRETAAEQLFDLRQRLGAEKYTALEGLAEAFWEARQLNVLPLLEKAGMFGGELMDKVRDNKAYATFDVIAALEKRYGRGVSAHVYKQLGTLQGVRNPFIATVMKDAALIRAAETNMAKEKTVAFLQASFPGDIQEADTRWNGRYNEPVPEPKDADMGSIAFLINGKVHAYYAPKDIAETFQRDPYEANVLIKAWLAINVPLREILVARNPLWMAFNLIRDAMGTLKNVPGITAPKLIKYYYRAFSDAYKDVVKDVPTDTVSEMLRKKMLVVERNFQARDTDAGTELDLLLQSFGKTPVRYRNMVVRPLVAFWNGLGKTGKFTERWAKIAGYKYLKDLQAGKEKGKGIFYQDKEAHAMTDKKIAHIVRTRIGTPDIYRRGAWNVFTNNFFMFSNVAKEGWRASWEAAREKPSAYAWKTVKFNIVPRLIFYGALAGLMGDALRQIAQGISDYDKENYINVPLGLTVGGKSVYLRIPQDYTGQVIGGLFWNLINGKVLGKGSLFSYGAGQSPYNLNPYLTAAGDLIAYMNGKNPYDDYRGRPVMPERVYKAGGSRAHQEMAKHLFGELGGGVFYRFEGDDIESAKSTLEKALRFPPGTILGRFLKISDAGVREDLREVAEKAGQKEAARQLDVRDRVIEVVNAATQEGRKPTKGEMVKLYRQLLKEGRIEPTMRIMQFRAMFNRYADRAADNARVDAVISAGSNAEKAALLRQYKQTMPAGEYRALKRQLVLEGHLSARALMKEQEMEEE